MKIALIGTGGVGGYFGAKLAKCGYDVSFLARGAHLDAMNKNGLHVKSIDGNFSIQNVKAYANITSMEPADLILVCVKAWQVKEIRADLVHILKPDSTVIPLQNGILAIDELSEQIPPKNIMGGLCRIISKIELPGVINHIGIAPTIVFGETDKTVSERANSIKQIFDTAGINSKISTDIEADLWKKFIAICVSGLLAVSKTTYGELRELKETRQMMIDVLKEIYQISQKLSVNIKEDFIEKSVSFIDSFPSNSTSSLTRDVWEGKPSEIEYQNGTVVNLGKMHGIETPVNSFIYNCILPMERKARKS